MWIAKIIFHNHFSGSQVAFSHALLIHSAEGDWRETPADLQSSLSLIWHSVLWTLGTWPPKTPISISSAQGNNWTWPEIPTLYWGLETLPRKKNGAIIGHTSNVTSLSGITVVCCLVSITSWKPLFHIFGQYFSFKGKGKSHPYYCMLTKVELWMSEALFVCFMFSVVEHTYWELLNPQDKSMRYRHFKPLERYQGYPEGCRW